MQLKKNLTVGALAGLFAYPALKLFLKSSPLGVAISTIPVIDFVHQKFNLTPVLSKIISFGIFAGLMVLSWFAAEIIVILMSIAFAKEAIALYKQLKKANDTESIPKRSRKLSSRKQSSRNNSPLRIPQSNPT